MKIPLTIVICLCVMGVQAADLISVEAAINGKPIQLGFDTGSFVTAIFGSTAERLGLKVTNAPSDFTPQPGQMGPGTTEKGERTLVGKRYEAALRVVDIPACARFGVDGILGW